MKNEFTQYSKEQEQQLRVDSVFLSELEDQLIASTKKTPWFSFGKVLSVAASSAFVLVLLYGAGIALIPGLFTLENLTPTQTLSGIIDATLRPIAPDEFRHLKATTFQQFADGDERLGYTETWFYGDNERQDSVYQYASFPEDRPSVYSRLVAADASEQCYKDDTYKRRNEVWEKSERCSEYVPEEHMRFAEPTDELESIEFVPITEEEKVLAVRVRFSTATESRQSMSAFWLTQDLTLPSIPGGLSQNAFGKEINTNNGGLYEYSMTLNVPKEARYQYVQLSFGKNGKKKSPVYVYDLKERTFSEIDRSDIHVNKSEQQYEYTFGFALSLFQNTQYMKEVFIDDDEIDGEQLRHVRFAVDEDTMNIFGTFTQQGLQKFLDGRELAYFDIWFHPKDLRLEQYTLTDKNGNVIERTRLEVDEIVDDVSPEEFFTQEYWEQDSAALFTE